MAPQGNLVRLPGCVVGSTTFNRHPEPLSIAGARESAGSLFGLLAGAQDLAQAAEIFRHYLRIAFRLDTEPDAKRRGGPRSVIASYRKLLEGWGFDSNSPQGAVLKGWVESRFGIAPTFHRAPLAEAASPAWVSYVGEKLGSRYQGNGIYFQLDLLFEFCQWSARRFAFPDPAPVPVWRGVNSVTEHPIVSGSLRSRKAILQLNNLVSFSLSREHAGQFGDWILSTRVPVEKLVFFPGLLGRSLLAGEGEVIALGGRYEVEMAYL